MSEEQGRRLRRRIKVLRGLRRVAAVTAWTLCGVPTMYVAGLNTDGIVDRAAQTVAIIMVALAWGQAARHVDYRWFDGFCVLIPVCGLFWMGRIVWRLTYRIALVPTRAWPSARVRRESWLDRVARRVPTWST